jgi:hypothetical protein
MAVASGLEIGADVMDSSDVVVKPVGGVLVGTAAVCADTMKTRATTMRPMNLISIDVAGLRLRLILC